MKKAISLILIFVFLITMTIQATNVAAENPSDADPATIETLEEVQAALADAKSKLSSAGLFSSIKLIKKIKLLEARLTDLLLEGDGAKPTKCASLFDQVEGRTDKAIEHISNNICPTTERTFYPMYEHCSSPFDLNCVCMHHPDRAGCENIGGGSMSMSSKPCISDISAQNAISDLQKAKDALAKLNGDSDSNTIPDVCEKQVEPQ